MYNQPLSLLSLEMSKSIINSASSNGVSVFAERYERSVSDVGMICAILMDIAYSFCPKAVLLNSVVSIRVRLITLYILLCKQSCI